MNPLEVTFNGSGNLYAIIRERPDGDVWNGTANVSWVDGDIDDYDIALASQGGDLYSADVPEDLPAGDYRALFYERAGATPATTDLFLTSRPFHRNGSAASEPDDSTRPVTWAEAKAHLRLTGDDDQTQVETMIDAATDFAESRMGCTLMQRTRTHVIYDGQPLTIPYGPVASITSIVDDDDNAITATLESIGNLQRLNISTASYSYPLTVTYVAGFASRSSIPASIRLAILQHVATMYEVRESINVGNIVTEIPHSLDMFYRYKSRMSGVA
jgi:uncharacterized phiE125 gp8 family phage protein